MNRGFTFWEWLLLWLLAMGAALVILTLASWLANIFAQAAR